MKLSNLLLLILTLLPIGSMAAKENYLDSYNLNRAYEEGEKGNIYGRIGDKKYI